MSKIIVISLDAMVYDDLEFARTLPNFKLLLDNGALVKRTRTIYPSVTYPAHTTMSTGAYPDKHGITHNLLYKPSMLKGCPWQWFSDAIKCPDIFTAAKKAGLSTASVFWPVTGNHQYIDYLVNEIWPQADTDTVKERFLSSGTSQEVYDECVAPFIDNVRIRKHPETDYFVVDCACKMIRSYKPDLLMMHICNIDSYRHQTGVFSSTVTNGIMEADIWIGQIIQATKNAGVFEDTNFFIVSDHGQMDVVRAVKPNVMLADKGYITYDENEKLVSWRAFCHSTGMSSQVYLKDPTDKKMWNEVYELLKQMSYEGIYGIGEVFTAEEIEKREHLRGDFSFVIESDGYSSFADGWTRPYIKVLDNSDYRFGHATHGYLPDKGPQPTLIAFGPDIQNGVVVDEHRPTVDEAPTYAKIFGIEMPWADGTPITEILKNV